MNGGRPEQSVDESGEQDRPAREIFSPIQPDPFNGIIFSSWSDGVVAFPDAIVPFRGVSSRYAVSAEMYPGVLSGASVALGLTASGALLSNLAAGGQVSLRLWQIEPFNGLNGGYELRVGDTVGGRTI